jgi:hypothetical protein
MQSLNGIRKLLTRTNEYVHFAEGQMFLATYAGMSTKDRIFLTLHMRFFWRILKWYHFLDVP